MDEVEEFTPRNYQMELMKIALEQNTIIFLPTGSGKTYIALMVLRQMGESLLKSYSNGGKISVILVNTVALVDQHANYINRHTDFEVGRYSGEMNLDFWPKDKWYDEFDKYQVLIMTSQIFVNLVHQNFVDLNKVNLLIFDECHRGVKDHCIRQLMKDFENLVDPPKILGLTATLLNRNCGPNKVIEEVIALETTFQSKVATVEELKTVVGYSTNPKEQIEIFMEHQPSSEESFVMELLNKCTSTLACLRPDQPTLTLKLNDLRPLNPEEGPKKLCNLVEDLKFHCKTMGTLAGLKACLADIIKIERLKKHCDDIKLLTELNYVETVLTFIHEFLKQEVAKYSKEEVIYNCSSDQVIKLLKILKNYKNVSKEELCGIIFTKRRFTARLIFHILEFLHEHDPSFKHIKANFVVGYNSNPFNNTRESLYLHKKNKEVLESFERKEINIIVASNVLEEGVDISKCTLVIKYDYPEDYRSYIQSKGRARHKESLYYMLVPNTKINDFCKKYEEFRKVENILNDYLIGRNESRVQPSKEAITAMYSEDELPPYYVDGPDSAKVSMVSAVSLLCSYCQSIPSDQYTCHAPDWYVKNYDNLYSVVITLPTASGILDMIQGPFMPNKKLAKRAAALITCEILHKAGKLDNHLLPKPNVIEEQDVQFLFTHYPKKKESYVGNVKTRRLHEKLIPAIINEPITADSTLYLHIIEINPTFSKRSQELYHVTMYDIYTAPLCYGLVTTSPLPILCDFPLFTTMGTLIVSLKVNQNTIFITNTDLNDIKLFHFQVFNGVLKVLQQFCAFDSGKNPEMILLVPVNRNLKDIDWKVLRSNINIHPVTEMSNEEKMNMTVNQESHLRKIICPWYRRDSATYIVMEVCLNKTSNSPFPNEEYSSFKEYFKTRHNIELRNPELPLLFVKGLSNSVNFIKPKGKAASKRKHNKTMTELEEYLPPELVVKQDFPSSLWIQAHLIPSVLTRITFMLQIEELRSRIAVEKGLGQKNVTVRKPLELDDYVLDYEPYLEEEKLCTDVSLTTNDMAMDTTDYQLTLSLPQPLAWFNQDFAKKLIESQYPWQNIDEPKDIERDLDVTVMDIEHYETFIGCNASINRELRNEVSPKKTSNQLALTYHKDFVPVNIKMLDTKLGKDGPELCELYRALTAAKANDIVNLERLETLGDSFLKLMSSVYIFLRFPQFDEGRATNLKGRLVSNKNLFYLALKKQINRVIKYNELSPKSEWLPPATAIPEEILQRIQNKEMSISELFNLDIPFEEQVSGSVSYETLEEILHKDCAPTDTEEGNNYASMAPFIKCQYFSDKHVADCIESLLGAYFQACGFKGGVKFLEWLGLIPESENLEEMLSAPPPDPLLCRDDVENKIRVHLPFRQEIERKIGYKFKNHAYLLQALTHASYTPNRTTLSYEKLEFLGDAVLDFLITCHIYESCGNLNPGQLTDLRSALVNNNTFASFVVRLGLQKYILMVNSSLQNLVDKFVKFMEQKRNVIDDEVIILLQEDEIQLAESINVPKVLGDIFEAIAGAIYLDSNKDLKVVWNVFYKIMWKEIELFSRNVPINLIRKLCEWNGAHAKFGLPIRTENDNFMVPLQFMFNGVPKRVYGVGSNKSMAKKAAAKIALQCLMNGPDNLTIS